LNGVNLIPMARRRVRGRRARVRLWAVLCGCYGLAVGGWYLWYGITSAVDAGSVAADLAAAQQRVADLEGKIKARAVRVAEADEAYEAALSISDQPDWGTLLAILGRGLGKDTVLSGCVLMPEAPRLASAEGGVAPAVEVRPGAYVLTVSGLGRTQEDVSKYVLDLEQTNLFSRVTLKEARRTEFLTGQAVAFTIECAMVDAGGGAR
jgi:hypothetical protein